MTIKKDHVVLFVDDEPALLEGLRNALRKEPYEVLTACSASEGLRCLHERRIDVVVSDERMPGASGSDFLSFVRQRFPDTVRIMLTGQCSLEAAIQAINEGEIYRLLTKPCGPVLLAQTLRDALLFLDLTREGARLLATVKQQRKRLDDLERSHPGIRSLGRGAEECVVLDGPLDAAKLLSAMREVTGSAGLSRSA
jgi:DNA-binding NtrC family response regulator